MTTTKKRACERTSYEVRRRYEKANYTALTYKFPNELVKSFKAKCLEKDISQASIIREAMEKFINEE